MRAYSQSAGYAEQALSAIKVVHSYGQEELENNNYKKYLIRATEVSSKLAFIASTALSSIYLIMFGFYAYAFFIGGLLRWSPGEWTKNGDE